MQRILPHVAQVDKSPSLKSSRERNPTVVMLLDHSTLHFKEIAHWQLHIVYPQQAQQIWTGFVS